MIKIIKFIFFNVALSSFESFLLLLQIYMKSCYKKQCLHIATSQVFSFKQSHTVGVVYHCQLMFDAYFLKVALTSRAIYFLICLH